MIELRQIIPQVDAMSENLAVTTKQKGEMADKASSLLRKYAAAHEEIREKVRVASERGLSWRGAFPPPAPLQERMDGGYPLPDMPPRVTVIASDGSQIYPDRHGVAMYYLVNVGSIVYRHGSGDAPDTEVTSRLYYREDELYEGEYVISTAGVNTRRDLAEVESLARICSRERGDSGDVPIVALADGPLLLQDLALVGSEKDRAQNLKRLSGAWGDMRAASAAAAGYVDRPRSTGVLGMLHLASTPPDRLTEEGLPSNPFVGLVDGHVFNFLGPGERSALFCLQSPLNDEYRRIGDGGYEVLFFYLNVGEGRAHTLARVEIPRHVAGDREVLDLLHAVIYHQGRLLRGYPYVLARAHELAVVTYQEKQDIDEMIGRTMRLAGIAPRISDKSMQKARTSYGKRRYGNL